MRANVGRHNLSHSGMSVDEFKNKAVEENGLFVLRERKVDENGAESERVRYFQDPRGRAPISTVDTDARWSTNTRHKRPDLHYKENVIVDGGGFILARRATRGSDGDWKPAHDMLEQLPIKPKTLAADTGYSAGPLRKKLEDLDITAPTYPSIPNRTTAWLPGRALPTVETTLCVLRGRLCGDAPSSGKTAVTSMSLFRTTVRDALSEPNVCRRDRRDDTWL